jgi:hypothetical protein
MQSIWSLSIEDESSLLTADQRAVEERQEQGVRKGRRVEEDEGEESKGQGEGQSLEPQPATIELISSAKQVVETVAVDVKASPDEVLQELSLRHSDTSPSPRTIDILPIPKTSKISVSTNIISSEIVMELHIAIVETKVLGLEDRRRKRKEKKDKVETTKEEEDKKEKGNGRELFIPTMYIGGSDAVESAIGGMNSSKVSVVRSPGDICVGRCQESVEQLKSHLAVTSAQYEKRIADLVREERRSRLEQGLPCLPVPVCILTLKFFISILIIIRFLT